MEQTCSTPKNISKRINETPTSSSAFNSSSVSSTTVLKEILIYPTLEKNVKTKKKNVKRALANFVSGPESMQLLLDEKLKKARQMAEKQQLRGKDKKDNRKPKMQKHKSHRDEKEKERLRLSKSQKIPMRGQVVRVPCLGMRTYAASVSNITI